MVSAPLDDSGMKYRKIKRANAKIQALGIELFLKSAGFEVLEMPSKENIVEEFFFFDVSKHSGSYYVPRIALDRLSARFPPQTKK